MILVRTSDRICRRWRRMSRNLDLAVALFILVIPATPSQAQHSTPAPAPPAQTEPAAPVDPLGRETPRGAMMGFLKYQQRQDYGIASRYLQAPPGQEAHLAERAKEIGELQRAFNGNIGLLSDDPNGTIEPGLPPGQIRAGVWSTSKTIVDVILVRVDDPTSGKIWLISKESVASVPKLDAEMASEAPTAADQIMPAALNRQRFLGMSLARWLGWLLSIPISFVLTWLLAFFLAAPQRIRCKLEQRPFRPLLHTRVRMPIKCMVAILLHSFFVYLLQPPLFYRVYYARLMAALLMGCLVWLLSTITDKGFEAAMNRASKQDKSGEWILTVMQRLTRALLLMVAFVAVLVMFGFNVKTMLAGLGIGGLAIALAAQKTLENIIGGVSLLMDKAVHVGDVCQIGDQRGTVEDIGLRSLKLRTIDQNLLVVPNGALAQMQFENMRGRTKLLINQTFALRIETQVEQLRFVLDRVQTMLDQHPAIERGTSRVRVTNFVGAAFAMELFAYGTTGDWTQFTTIRQDVILKIAEIVTASGTQFAAPTQLAYLTGDAGVDLRKASGVLRHVTELQTSDIFEVPGKTP